MPMKWSPLYYDSAAVAKLLGLSECHLRRLVRAGTLRACRIGPKGRLRYLAEDVQKLLVPAGPNDEPQPPRAA